MKKQLYIFWIFLFFLFSVFPLAAKVLRVEVESRTVILNGKTFGNSGQYELIKGRIFYGFDPSNQYNERITDIQLAPKNADGLVEAWGNLAVLQPVDAEKSCGVALVEVSNRGGKFSPAYFNRASKGRELLPNDPDYWGDGLLMENGLTVIWIGWQFDIPEGEHNLKLHVPQAVNSNGTPIYGKVRSDWTIDKPVKSLSLGHHNLVGYPAVDLESDEHTLTVRDGRDGARRIINQSEWQFAREENGELQVSDRHISLEGGFLEGKIYELVYLAKDPAIVGLGQAAIRDVIAYAKYDPSCEFSIKKGIAAGVSQTGRFLRNFLYKGFNTDEQGRMAYDGMMIITAGAGRGSFNHRFGQPSRDAHRYSAFFYPTDIFPFTGIEQTDPLTEESDGLYQHLFDNNHLPRIFSINSGYEYWGRTASLIHTDPLGSSDVEPHPNERIYHLASGQHFVGAFPPRTQLPSDGADAYRGNPVEIKANYRALFIKLLAWVKDDTAPPESRYPKVSNGTLVRKEELKFPKIPGIDQPTTIHHAYRADYGPNWNKGIVDHQPPELGYAFPAMVAQVDNHGNELGGVRNVEVTVPLATYTPWSLRTGFKGGSHELFNFQGMFIPLPLNEAQKKATGDPRPSLASLYESKDVFLMKVRENATQLAKEGFLLERDIDYVVDRAGKTMDWIQEDAHQIQDEFVTQGPKKGSLIVIGGGRLDTTFYNTFMKLAGGPDAKVVLIPTAAGDNFLNNPESFEQLKTNYGRVGFKNLTILHTKDPKVADTDEFVKPIREATGVWFTGGRQWRLADSYLNNKTHEALKDLLNRGGVIAGSSAGATIQGSYLARGDSGGNTVMMGDHEEGLSFITNIAIDQHVMARNRQFDMFEILEHRPELLGIGLDENTGIVVKGDQFEVIGSSLVVIYDGKKYAPERRAYFPLAKNEKKFYFLRKGQKYDMAKREVVR